MIIRRAQRISLPTMDLLHLLVARSEVSEEHRRVEVNSFDGMKEAESSQPGIRLRHPQSGFGGLAHTLPVLHLNECHHLCSAYVLLGPGVHSCFHHDAHHRCRIHGPERSGAPVYHQLSSRRTPRRCSDVDRIRVHPDMRKVEHEGSCFDWAEVEGDAVELR